jgi:GTP-binding protein
MIKFVGSFETVKSLPKTQFAEYAFIGRSNVGKSSLINAIVGIPIARTSNTPGRTQSLNLFNLDDRVMIVDLPGYGYAKVSKEAQAKWQRYLEEYLLNRKQITSLIQFVDARHEIQRNDFQMRKWVEAYNLPIFTIVTKVDCIQRGKIQKVLADVRKEFGGDVLPFSSASRYYCDSTIDYLLNLSKNSNQ